MTVKPLLLAVLLLTLGACAQFADSPALRALQPETGAHAMLGELSRVASLSAEQRRRELAGLEGARLDDARRFQLAALLERDDSPDAPERGLRALNALDPSDARAQALVELMKRSLRARIELRQQSARAQELQDKLDQIKTLEKSLQQRTPAKP
ncbi:MAG: hypothetical protein AB1720_09205 [Pseudomonadota bacterium]